MKLLFVVRNYTKMIIQNILLPVVYFVESKRYRGEKIEYVFADAHHTSIPFSLEAMYNYITKKGIKPVCHFYDYTHEGALRSLTHAISFMKILVRARYVFICDNFLPVSSCKKDSDTKVIQLCHFSGPIKKIGYTTQDDVPAYYNGNVYENYDLVTVSAENFIPLIQEAFRQKEGIVKALGISRTDVFFDDAWVGECKDNFYKEYPHAVNKKIILWAPTFRGKASSPNILDNESMIRLQEKLGDEWLVLIKHHPHDDAVAEEERYKSNCTISSERLLPVVDVLITDYSTIVLDYLFFDKPFILYAPDIKEYERTRGFFVDYYSITKNITQDASKLDVMISDVYDEWLEGKWEDINYCKEQFVSACDGNSTERIANYLMKL